MKQILLVVALSMVTNAYAGTVPGMTCDQVGGFAVQVMYEKQDGTTLKEQLKELHESLSGGNFRDTERALAGIIKAIYQQPHLSSLSPEVARSVFTQDCDTK